MTDSRGRAARASSPSTTCSTSPRRRPPRTSRSIGGMEALDAPYLDIGFLRDDPQARRLARRSSSSARCSPPRRWATSRTRSPSAVRAGALRAADHLLGGNSGSQATSLIIRALALREVAAARLVARAPAARCSAAWRSACSSGVHRLRCASSLWPGHDDALRAALPAGGASRWRFSLVGRGALRHAGRLDAAVPAAPARASTRPRPRRRSSPRWST